jgi:uncharacterized protein (DUF2249 family)
MLLRVFRIPRGPVRRVPLVPLTHVNSPSAGSRDALIVMNEPFVTLDVREELRAGREPLANIMKAVASVASGQNLRLVAPFEPTPLFFVLDQMGFAHRERLLEPGSWEILVERRTVDTPVSAPPVTTPSASAVPARFTEVDARGLEPPEPMVAILEALAALPDWAELHAYTDRRPIHLYLQLAARGFTGESEERPDESFITRIRHNA